MSLFIGIEAAVLTADDRRRLAHPDVSGVILFSRNFTDTAQLAQLVEAIRAIAPQLLISVDHEGGRVQRFREGFTVLPPMQAVGALFDDAPLSACRLAEACGVILAYELRRFDIDFSFAPVLDLYDAQSSVIGSRAFHANPAAAAELAIALRRGMRRIGMAAVGKHYPGHGRVQGDSHHVLPVDTRPHSGREADRYPFVRNIEDGIEAIMTAHILLPENSLPAGFAVQTLDELRSFGFDGAIFSDDLDMAGAKFFTYPHERVQAALDAGADAAMICNTFADMDAVLAHGAVLRQPQCSVRRLAALRARPLPETADADYASALAIFSEYNAGTFLTPEMP